MSLSNKKFLISGCGFSWSQQQHKTWVNVLRATGADIHDVGGPAVSNQWILNQALLAMLEQPYDHVVIQLTSIGKLDVEMLEDRQQILVEKDSLRNFVIGNVWPSSHSIEHESKDLYMKYLFSPGLETQDLFCKILMLADWCRHRAVGLTIIQVYQIPWTDQQIHALAGMVEHMERPLYELYERSEHFEHHDWINCNMVPCVGFHCDLALQIATKIAPEIVPKILVIKETLKSLPKNTSY